MGCIIRNKRTPVKYRCSFYKKRLEDILLAWYVVLGNHFSLLNEQVERKKLFALESYSKGQSYVGYGVTREGCTVFLCFKRILAAFLVFLPLPQSVPFLLEYL